MQFEAEAWALPAPALRFECKYSAYHGVAAAACFFSRKVNQRVSETTVHSIRKAYIESVRKQRGLENEEIQDLPRGLRDDTRHLGICAPYSKTLFCHVNSKPWV